MGLVISVCREVETGDCTAGGISGRHGRLTVVNIDGPFDPTPDAPAVALIDGHRPGDKILVPVISNGVAYQRVSPEGFTGPMFGGNFGATSDSRFGRATGIYGAIPIHDRFETHEVYAAMSD